MLHVCCVSHETPYVTPSRNSPPLPVFRTRLARNTRCNTMSHLTVAGCSWGEESGRIPTPRAVLVHPSDLHLDVQAGRL